MQTINQPRSKAFTIWTEDTEGLSLERIAQDMRANRDAEIRSLPSKPSALIRVALADLRKVEALPDIYRVNMDVWHREHRADAVCEVCLAGSVICQELGANPSESRGPEDFDQETTWKLYALNEFRVGNVFDGLCYLSDEPSGRLYAQRYEALKGKDECCKYVEVAEYTDDPAAFHADMQKLASDLEASGL
jgi:hypothetical protein